MLRQCNGEGHPEQSPQSQWRSEPFVCVSSAPSKAFKGVENRKHLLIADKPHDYADFVSEIVSDPSAFEDIRSAGRQFIVENHSWERAGSIYTQAVQAGLKSTPQVAPTIKSAG